MAEIDKRFSDASWESHPAFKFVKDAYLATSTQLQETVDGIEGLDEKTHAAMKFWLRQGLDAMAPSNFVQTNPKVLKLTVESQGQNLVQGFNNFLDDLKRGLPFSIKMTDMDAFTIGENLAITPGKVIFRNQLIELIQYNPQTETVFERPLLIVPPWINKYYILDLGKQNSFVQWAVSQGHTVFMISWKNPNGEDKDLDFEDYLKLGPLTALDIIIEMTGQAQVNTL